MNEIDTVREEGAPKKISTLNENKIKINCNLNSVRKEKN